MGDDLQKKIFARNLTYFLNLNNKKQIDLSNELNIGLSTINSWCTGSKMPRMDKVQLLADYFGIGKTDLLDDKSQENTYYIDKESSEAAQFLFENPEYKVLFDASRKVKPQDINFVADMINRVTGTNDDDTGC